MEDQKIYFMPGERVQLKQDIQNKPTMIVVGKVSSIFKHSEDKENILKGIKCIWFDKQQVLHEYIFNTKDLIKL